MFASGRASYYDEDVSRPSETARVHVRIDLEGVSVFALLDTGSSWSIVNTELADELGLFDREGQDLDVSSRIGTFAGKLVRAKTTLMAEDGESVEIESTVFISREWPAGNFIGYAGLLERVRFAVDPGTNSFYFGVT